MKKEQLLNKVLKIQEINNVKILEQFIEQNGDLIVEICNFFRITINFKQLEETETMKIIDKFKISPNN